MLKRAFDIVVSLMGLTIFSPLLLILSLTIRMTSPGPALYRAERVGRNGQSFTLLKFRSMVMDADKLGPGVTGAADRRVTSVGRFLRRTKLDELPQLINVLRGDMSIVGPRPEDRRYVALYSEVQRKVLSVRPGITSPASMKFRDEESLLAGEDWETHYIESVMPQKLAIDLEYVHKVSIWQDIKIILGTLRVLIVS